MELHDPMPPAESLGETAPASGAADRAQLRSVIQVGSSFGLVLISIVRLRSIPFEHRSKERAMRRVRPRRTCDVLSSQPVARTTTHYHLSRYYHQKVR